jgi:hypothetical protein
MKHGKGNLGKKKLDKEPGKLTRKGNLKKET